MKFVCDVSEGVRKITSVLNPTTGTEVVKGSPTAPLMYNQHLGVGTHTVDFQAMAREDHDVTAGPRGLTVMDLIPLV